MTTKEIQKLKKAADRIVTQKYETVSGKKVITEKTYSSKKLGLEYTEKFTEKSSPIRDFDVRKDDKKTKEGDKP